MNSCLYACDVMHYRLEPKENRFSYGLFTWCIDVDEIDALTRQSFLISRNRWNIFSFYDSDHLDAGAPRVRENLARFMVKQGTPMRPGKILLVTHLRLFGYVFNPVSFYFCFDEKEEPYAVVAEVGNTFHEQKGFLLDKNCREEDVFTRRVQKNFYVSPFIDMDAEFDFRLRLPGERLQLLVDDYKKGKKFFLSSVTGQRRPLTTARLAFYLFRYPLVTLRVISMIHWQALILKLKGLPHWKKSDHPELQQGAVPVRARRRVLSHV